MSNFAYGFDNTQFQNATNQSVRDMAAAHAGMTIDDYQLRDRRQAEEMSVLDSLAASHKLNGTPFLHGWQEAVGDTGMNGNHIQSIQDAGGSAIGLAFNRMLEFDTNKVMEPKEQPYDALRLFGTNSSIPEGYTSWVAKREEYTSSWEYAKGNPNTVPTSGFDRFEETFHIIPAVHAIRINQHEMKSAAQMRIALASKLHKIAERGRKEFLNTRAWNNDQPGLSDILSYSWVPRIFSPATIGDGSVTEDTEVKIICSAARHSRGKSKNINGPTRGIMARDLYDYLNETYRSDKLDTTLFESLKKTCSYISAWEVSDDLTGIGPNGESAIVFDRPGAIQHVLPVPMARLPVQRQGYDLVFHLYMVHGGIEIEQPTDCTIFFAQVAQ